MATRNILEGPIVTVGGEKKRSVNDAVLIDLVNTLIIQIKIMNEHLSIITGENLNETDIDKGES